MQWAANGNRLIVDYTNSKELLTNHLENIPGSEATVLLPSFAGSAGRFTRLKKSDSTMIQTRGSHFGIGMADLVPGSRIVEKHSCVRPIFESKGAKLTDLRAISIE
jgi:hypothetical protein